MRINFIGQNRRTCIFWEGCVVERPDTIFPCKRSSGLLLLAATSRRKLLYALIIDLCFRTDHFRQVSLLLVSSSSSFFSSPGTLDRARSRRLISSVGFPGTERGEKSEFACRAERGRVPLAMQIRKRSVAKQTILDFVNDRVACFWREGENWRRLLSSPWKGTQRATDGWIASRIFVFSPLAERYVITVLRDRSISRESERRKSKEKLACG